MDEARPVVTICGSMKVIDQMVTCARTLERWGAEVLLPVLDEPADYGTISSERRAELKSGLIRTHLDKIRHADAVLVVNPTLGDRPDYVGANSFLEMGFAFALDIPIALLHGMPDQPNSDEIAGLLPTCLHGDLTRITALIAIVPAAE